MKSRFVAYNLGIFFVFLDKKKNCVKLQKRMVFKTNFLTQVNLITSTMMLVILEKILGQSVWIGYNYGW